LAPHRFDGTDCAGEAGARTRNLWEETTIDPRRLIAWSALVFMLAGCVPPPQQVSRPPVNPNCHPGYPRGISGNLGNDLTFRLRFQVTASYEFKDPNLAKERVPELFVQHLNRHAGYQKYFVADGPNFNANIFLNVDKDATGDHYGMSVRMSGPAQFTAGEGRTVPSVNWFRFYQSPNYRTGAKLIEDAGIKTAQFLNNGWTC
jgi:hypothetical protein